jgi:hypothetical protein
MISKPMQSIYSWQGLIAQNAFDEALHNHIGILGQR